MRALRKTDSAHQDGRRRVFFFISGETLRRHISKLTSTRLRTNPAFIRVLFLCVDFTVQGNFQNEDFLGDHRSSATRKLWFRLVQPTYIIQIIIQVCASPLNHQEPNQLQRCSSTIGQMTEPSDLFSVFGSLDLSLIFDKAEVGENVVNDVIEAKHDQELLDQGLTEENIQLHDVEEEPQEFSQETLPMQTAISLTRNKPLSKMPVGGISEEKPRQ